MTDSKKTDVSITHAQPSSMRFGQGRSYDHVEERDAVLQGRTSKHSPEDHVCFEPIRKTRPNQENEADSLISKDVIIVAVDLVFSLLVLVIVIIIVVIAFIVVSKASVVIIGLNSGYRCL